MLGCANQEAPTKLYNEIKLETTNYWIYTQRLTRNKKQHKPFGIPSLYRYICLTSGFVCLNMKLSWTILFLIINCFKTLRAYNVDIKKPLIFFGSPVEQFGYATEILKSGETER